MEEILPVNRLENLRDLHLLAQSSRGRSRLVKSFADYIMDKFPKLRHFGNFVYWRLKGEEVESIIAQSRSLNRDITFDEDLKARLRSDGRISPFEYRYIPGRSELHCSKIPARRLTHFFDVLPQLVPNLLGDNFVDESDDDDDDFDDEDDDAFVDDFAPDDVGGFVVDDGAEADDLQANCAIM